MPRVDQSADFFVVGSPVQADRESYISRYADEQLWDGLRARRFCYALGPHGSGKTSLMARTILRLRADNKLAAVVDLSQIGSRGESTEAGRWYYSIAYRIVRELRLKVDLQTWWQEKSVLVGEQRLADFFWEVVLAHTSEPVTIFFDDIERGLELPFSRELFVAISACYDARATEPEYRRLNFVVLGIATPRELGHGIVLPLFEDGLAIDVGDFSIEESYQLSEGFNVDAQQAHAVLARIYYWVKGQPYLTQKIARAVARRNGTVDDVDDVVNLQFLSANARAEEPLLAQTAATLKRRGPVHRRALVVLGRLAKGLPVVANRDSTGQALLALAGIATVGDAEFVTYRNRLVKALYTSRWVRTSLPFDWRAAAAAAAAIAALILIPIWYTQYFPRPYIETLAGIVDDYELALETHDKLRRFPGFGATADQLLADIMIRRSDGSVDYTEVQAADGELRNLEGYAAAADSLLGAYWLRRAEAAVRAARRDEALVYADLARIGGDPKADALTARLTDTDYAALLDTYRFDAALTHWAVGWPGRGITTVDATRSAKRFLTGDDAGAIYERPITALRHLSVSRELAVDVPGSADDFQLQIDLEHAAPEQLVLMLESPGGAAARFSLPPSGGSRFELRAVGRSPIALLADEDRQGVWRLTLIDRQQGIEGRLDRWALQFAEELRDWVDVPDQGLAIPDPQRTDQVVVHLSRDGRFAVAYPASAVDAGALTLWDLDAGEMLADLPIEGVPDSVVLNADATRVIAVVANALTIWDVGTLAVVARIATQTGFAISPIFSVDGQYVAISEQIDASTRLYSLFRATDGELVASVEGDGDVDDWVLGPQGRYLALLEAEGSVRLIDPRRGELLAELPIDADPVEIVGAMDDALVTVDEFGDIVSWPIAEAIAGIARGRFLGVTADPLSLSLSDDGRTVAYLAANGHVVVRDTGNEAVRLIVRVPANDGPTRTRLAPDGAVLATASESALRLWAVGASDPAAESRVGISAMALDDTGQVVVVGYRDGHLRIRTAAQIDERFDAVEDIAYIGHRGAIAALAVNAAQGVIASGGRDGVVRLWELATGAPRTPYLRHPDGPINALAISRDAQLVVSAAADGARLWTAETGELVRAIPANQAALSVAISPDGATVASGDVAGNVFVTSLASRSSPPAARAQAAVTSLAYSPDGARLASGDRSGRVQLWDAQTVEPLGAPLALPQAVRWLAFSGDGARLTVQTDHWVHRVAVDGVRLAVDSSRMIGVDRAIGAPTVIGSDAVRLVGGRERGVAEVEEIPWQGVTAIVGALEERDWQHVLQLALDSDTGVVELEY